MTKPHLRACSTCARHIRVSEEACPFCGSTLEESFRAAPPPQAPGARLTRAALFALGTGAVALSPACSSSSSAPAPSDDAGPSHGVLDSGIQPAYGGPTFEGGIQPVYGAPAEDAAPPPGNAIDSGAQPAYGAPALDGGH